MDASEVIAGAHRVEVANGQRQRSGSYFCVH
jgi:hypothetical protein